MCPFTFAHCFLHYIRKKRRTRSGCRGVALRGDQSKGRQRSRSLRLPLPDKAYFPMPDSANGRSRPRHGLLTRERRKISAFSRMTEKKVQRPRLPGEMSPPRFYHENMRERASRNSFSSGSDFADAICSRSQVVYLRSADLI